MACCYLRKQYINEFEEIYHVTLKLVLLANKRISILCDAEPYSLN